MRRGEDRADVSEAQAAAESPSRPAGPGEADADRLPVQHGRVQGPVGINTRRARILVKNFPRYYHCMHAVYNIKHLHACTPNAPSSPLNLKCYTASFYPSVLSPSPTYPKKSHSHPKRNETFPPAIPPKKTPRPSVRLMTPIPQTTALYNIKRTESVPTSLTRSDFMLQLAS